MSKSKIEWTEHTWNPIAGCNDVSEGCRNCYARGMAKRLEAMGSPKYEGLTVMQGTHNVWTGKIAFDEAALLAPLKRKKPTRYFVNSMSDLFHPNVTDEMRDRIFAVMALCPQHTFQVLTKRPDRMLHWFTKHYNVKSPGARELIFEISHKHPNYIESREWVAKAANAFDLWPLRNVWLGVSVEDQKTADLRIPLLLQTPAVIRYVSYEPALGPVSFDRLGPGPWPLWGPLSGYCSRCFPKHHCGCQFQRAAIDWVICGGESGLGARPMNPDWARHVRDQCVAAGVPFFFKQWGKKAAGRLLDGREWNEMPSAREKQEAK